MRGVGGFLWEMVRRDYTCRGFFLKLRFCYVHMYRIGLLF